MLISTHQRKEPWSVFFNLTNYDPFRPIPQTNPRPSENVWEVWARHKLFSCELKYHGELGVEAQIFENGDLIIGRRFDTRQWAMN